MNKVSSDADDLIARFEIERPRYKRAAAAVADLLNELLAARSLLATITTRVKEVESFRAKIAAKTHYTDPWRQITDKAGVRAMVYRSSHVDEIHEIIRDDGRLEIHQVTDKRGMLRENELGYSGLHLDLYAPSEDDDSERVTVELQIRTYAQHAWSEVSHKLLYKPQEELNAEDRRAVWRLVALVEVFDREVARVMEVMPALPTAGIDPSGQPVGLTDALAAQYARFEHNAGRPDLTRIVADVLLAGLLDGEQSNYANRLHTWVNQEYSHLREFYNEYGPRSPMAAVSDYVLWSQPESVGVLEALETRPWALVDAWRDRGLPDRWLQPLAAVGTEVDLGLA
jgi:ppGpp synthetase/RelA/SpoT-type nucleotidyltranferase